MEKNEKQECNFILFIVHFCYCCVVLGEMSSAQPALVPEGVAACVLDDVSGCVVNLSALRSLVFCAVCIFY